MLLQCFLFHKLPFPTSALHNTFPRCRRSYKNYGNYKNSTYFSVFKKVIFYWVFVLITSLDSTKMTLTLSLKLEVIFSTVTVLSPELVKFSQLLLRYYERKSTKRTVCLGRVENNLTKKSVFFKEFGHAVLNI